MPMPATTSRIEGATFSRRASTATAASTASMNSSVCMIAVMASPRSRPASAQIKFDITLTVSASTVRLKKNAMAPCTVAMRRIALLVIDTSETCEVMPSTSEK